MKSAKIIAATYTLIVLAIGFGVGILARSTPIDGADWVGFGGAALGAALPIIGALFLLEYDRRAQSTERRAIMRALVNDIRKWIVRVDEPFVGVEHIDWPFYQSHAAKELAAAIARTKEARQHFTPTSIGMVQAYDTIGKMTVDVPQIEDDLLTARNAGGGHTALVHRLHMLEILTRQALAELEIEWIPELPEPTRKVS